MEKISLPWLHLESGFVCAMCWAHNYDFINKNYPLQMRALKSKETSLAFVWICFRCSYNCCGFPDGLFTFHHKKRTIEFCVLYVCLFNQEKNREFFISKYKWKKSDLFYECVPLQLNDFFLNSTIARGSCCFPIFFHSFYLCSTFVQCSFQLFAAHRKQRDRNKDDGFIVVFIVLCKRVASQWSLPKMR